VLAGGLLLSLAVAVSAGPPLEIRFVPDTARPGDLVLVQVRGAPADLQGELADRPLRFFETAEGVAALAGVDLETPARPIPWQLLRPMPGSGRLVVGTGALAVLPRAFATQRLTLPRSQVDLDAATLARVRAEQVELRETLGRSAAERLWRGRFRLPVEGAHPTGGFGLRRIINGQPRSPHAGYDWAAPRATPVLAANAGRVALVEEHFFAGRLVVLDHGLGLFTLYFHLDQARVAPGEAVGSGQPIGTVGATGRATGPHLHFAVSLDGARVDPIALLELAPPVLD
jgi:hypothetical protein